MRILKRRAFRANRVNDVFCGLTGFLAGVFEIGPAKGSRKSPCHLQIRSHRSSPLLNSQQEKSSMRQVRVFRAVAPQVQVWWAAAQFIFLRSEFQRYYLPEAALA